ncbi:MAG TPA: glucose-6-phosphate isomerase [Candidatus Dormibacteraeota bacterium]|nr:glucose-6-phosphate isomerase [Candidatus Dormibacteraeota bacterium]
MPAARLLDHAPAVSRRLAALGRSRFIERMWRGDASLWARDAAARRIIRGRLGWLRAPAVMRRRVSRIEAFAHAARREGTRHVVLLGMGGSSLCVEVLGRVFRRPPGHPGLLVLDSTVPSAVRRVESRLDLSKTLFVVASKSGTTAETAALQSYFWALARRRLGRAAARHFAAITDPGTPLADIASSRGYRALFPNPPDIGGRYSALSYFGLVPAALAGIDTGALLRGAAAMLEACGPAADAARNPGLVLGAALGMLARRGRDKIVLVVDRGLAPYGLWIEQLLAESTGKKGRGLVPVVAPAAPGARSAALAGPDRFGIGIVLEGTPDAGRIQAVMTRDAGRGARGGAPHIVLTLRHRYELGASMLQWEIAVAVAGAILGINPFDEPNVAESKRNSEAALAELAARGGFEEDPPGVAGGRARIFLSGLASPAHPPSAERAAVAAAARALLSRRRAGDYVALLAYVDPLDRALGRSLERLRARLASRTGLATTVGYGPRYLHSTGQLHKGGPGTGLFLEIVPDDAVDLPIPGKPFGFETLKQAQALGDYRSLKRRRRRALRLRYLGGAARALRALAGAIRSAGGPGRRGRGSARRRGHAGH